MCVCVCLGGSGAGSACVCVCVCLGGMGVIHLGSSAREDTAYDAVWMDALDGCSGTFQCG